MDIASSYVSSTHVAATITSTTIGSLAWDCQPLEHFPKCGAVNYQLKWESYFFLSRQWLLMVVLAKAHQWLFRLIRVHQDLRGTSEQFQVRVWRTSLSARKSIHSHLAPESSNISTLLSKWKPMNRCDPAGTVHMKRLRRSFRI